MVKLNMPKLEEEMKVCAVDQVWSRVPTHMSGTKNKHLTHYRNFCLPVYLSHIISIVVIVVIPI